MQAYESIWTWWGPAAGMAVPAGSGPAPPAGQVGTPTQAFGEGPPLGWQWPSRPAWTGRPLRGDQQAPVFWSTKAGGWGPAWWVRILASSRDRSTSLGGPRQPAAVAVLGR